MAVSRVRAKTWTLFSLHCNRCFPFLIITFINSLYSAPTDDFLSSKQYNLHTDDFDIK